MFYSLTLKNNMLFHLSLCQSETTRKKSSTYSPGGSGGLRKIIKKNESDEHIATNRGGWQDGTDRTEEDEKDCCAQSHREQFHPEG